MKQMKRLTFLVLAASTLTLTARATALVNTGAIGAETVRKIYVSAADSKGAVVTDLTAADITVKEGGKEYPVTSLQPAKTPMQVIILVDDGGAGTYQVAVSQFLQKMFGRGTLAISVLMPRATKIVDFTADFAPLKDGISQLGPRARVRPDGDQLPDAIDLAAKALRQMKAERPVIVVLTIAGATPQLVDPVNVLNSIRLSGASLNVLSGTRSDLGQTMNDGPKQSGGRIEEAGSQAATTPAVIAIADMLLGQYQLTYTLPDGVKMSDKLAVTTSRKGVTLTAPTRIPDK